MYYLHLNGIKLSTIPKEEVAFGFSYKWAITVDLLCELKLYSFFFFYLLNAIKITAVFISRLSMTIPASLSKNHDNLL